MLQKWGSCLACAAGWTVVPGTGALEGTRVVHLLTLCARGSEKPVTSWTHILWSADQSWSGNCYWPGTRQAWKQRVSLLWQCCCNAVCAQWPLSWAGRGVGYHGAHVVGHTWPKAYTAEPRLGPWWTRRENNLSFPTKSLEETPLSSKPHNLNFSNELLLVLTLK